MRATIHTFIVKAITGARGFEKLILNDSIKFSGDYDIHVWTAHIDETVPVEELYSPVLSRDEQERVKRFRFVPHRNRYITLHYAIRRILSLYMQIPPRNIMIEKGTYGKPFIKEQPHNQLISFNASSTSNMIAIACAQNRNLGIDIEYVDPKLNIEAIIPSLYSTDEMKQFKLIDNSNRLEHVLRFWTAKEAYVKALGSGLHYPLKDITLHLSEQNTLYVSQAKNDDPRMAIIQFYPANGYIGSLAYDGLPASIEYRKWKPQ